MGHMQNKMQNENNLFFCANDFFVLQKGSTPLISTIVEPVEPNGLAGFSLCPEIGRINDMPVCCGQNLPRRQTEIPTDLFSEVVGIIVLCVFVVDLDFIVEQDDLVHEVVDQ